MRAFYLTGTVNAQTEAELTDAIAATPLTRLYVIRGLTIVTLSSEPIQPGQVAFELRPNEKIYNL